MRFDQKITLKNGKEAWLRNGDATEACIQCAKEAGYTQLEL